MISLQIKPNICDKEIIELLQQCVVGGRKGFVGGADSNKHAILVGLHACGDLSSTMLHMFTMCHHIIGLVSVGCCYMKLTCASAFKPHPSTPIGYPLSRKIKSLDRHLLTYESRELACHALELYRGRVLSECAIIRILIINFTTR